MKAAQFLVINCCLILTHARLMYKTTETPKTNLEVVDEASKEWIDHSHSGEYFKFFNRHVRTAPESQDKVQKAKIATGAKINKTVLVKKPIPKFHDVNSDEDYQSKMKRPLTDTAEHEDEDFNVDDYDFDVNHDEFSGRGKPLEPRMKKNNKHADPKRFAPILHLDKEYQVKSKVLVTRKVADKMKEDQYDDDGNDPKTTEYSTKTTTDDSSDENDDSNEYRPPVRTARSPWHLRDYIYKIDDKSSVFISKLLGILPIFPQQPPARRLDEEVTLI